MKNKEIHYINPSELKVSEHYVSIYGDSEELDPLLVSTIKKEGIKEPLIIDSENRIISGVLRWKIACDLSTSPEFQRHFATIPVIIADGGNTIVDIVIHNQGRTKKFSQRLREIKLLKEEFLPGRGSRQDLKHDKGKSKEELKKILGLSDATIFRLEKIEELLPQIFPTEPEGVQKKWELLDAEKLSVTGLYNWCLKQMEKQNSLDIPHEFRQGEMVLHNQSCEDLSCLKAKSIDCVITSPPYFGQRLYDNGSDELGTENNVLKYIDKLVKLLDNTKSKLTENGSLIVNIADTTIGGKMALVPHRLVIEMNRKGWHVNTTIIWAKTNPQFSGLDKRPNPSHEYIFQFYQGKKPYYNTSWLSDEGDVNLIAPIIYGQNGEKGNKNLKSVWKFDNEVIETAVYNSASMDKVTAELKLRVSHPAMMNDLVSSILIKSFTNVNDHVVDIFNGANTTGITCTQLGRNFTGFEINQDLFNFGVERTKQVKYKKVNNGNQHLESKIAA